MIMSREDLVRGALTSVAPESENQPIEPEADFRDQNLDSMDFLNFVIPLHEAAGVDIPEKDYPQLASLRGLHRLSRRPSRAALRPGDRA
jgi:acyl carrier protein